MSSREPIPPELDAPAFRAAWEEWCAHRAELSPRKPYTPRMQRMALRRCQRWGTAAAIAAIEHSIANGYQGLFPDPTFRAEAPSAAPARPAIAEGMRDALVRAYHAEPQYWEHHGWPLDRVKALSDPRELPFALRQAANTQAAQMGLRIRI